MRTCATGSKAVISTRSGRIPGATIMPTSHRAPTVTTTSIRLVPTGSRAVKDPMPTSATGTSNSATTALRNRAAGGFTLLELLVVIVIIGIITTMATISVHVLGGDHEMQQEAERLQAILTQVREDAMMQGRDIGLRVDGHGYDFLDYDPRTELWRTVEG